MEVKADANASLGTSQNTSEVKGSSPNAIGDLGCLPIEIRFRIYGFASQKPTGSRLLLKQWLESIDPGTDTSYPAPAVTYVPITTNTPAVANTFETNAVEHDIVADTEDTDDIDSQATREEGNDDADDDDGENGEDGEDDENDEEGEDGEVEDDEVEVEVEDGDGEIEVEDEEVGQDEGENEDEDEVGSEVEAPIVEDLSVDGDKDDDADQAEYMEIDENESGETEEAAEEGEEIHEIDYSDEEEEEAVDDQQSAVALAQPGHLLPMTPAPGATTTSSNSATVASRPGFEVSDKYVGHRNKYRHSIPIFSLNGCPPPLSLLQSCETLNNEAMQYCYEKLTFEIDVFHGFGHISFFEETIDLIKTQIAAQSNGPLDRVRKVKLRFVWDSAYMQKYKDAPTFNVDALASIAAIRANAVYGLITEAMPRLKKVEVEWHDTLFTQKGADLQLALLEKYQEGFLANSFQEPVEVKTKIIMGDANRPWCKGSPIKRQRREFRLIRTGRVRLG